MLDGPTRRRPHQDPIYILKGLRAFIPDGPKRALMGSGLQEFFSLIEAVSEESD